MWGQIIRPHDIIYSIRERGTSIFKFITSLLFNKATRPLILGSIRKLISLKLKPGKNNKYLSSSPRIMQEKKLMVSAILNSVERSIQKKIISPKITSAVLSLWSKAVATPKNDSMPVRKFYKRYGEKPPWFLVISPGHACNLKCDDCYAASNPTGAKLGYKILDRLIGDALRMWDIKLIVFSGGEPFAYQSEGKGILDIAQKYQDCLFLTYTNGMLIDRDTASRIAECKNLTPAISVEGMRETTDKRRGNGIFDRVLSGMELLRQHGVPFGISVTANSSNQEEILADGFLDYFFKEQGTFYAFYFQYLPMGRKADFELMPSPGQRVAFVKKLWDVIERKSYFILDFWNHGTLVKGCVAAGRQAGGYFHIDWNGKVMPCVFAPYSPVNINDIYSQSDKTINDIWEAPFFGAIREWQKEQGHGSSEPKKEGNLLMPCPYRDHYARFAEWIEKYRPEPEDGSEKDKISKLKYYEKMTAYDKELAILLDPLWQEEYKGAKGDV